MPYSRRDAWSKASREFIQEKMRTTSKVTWLKYMRTMERTGKELGYVNPKDLRLQDLQLFESTLRGKSGTRSQRCTTLRAFLVWTGNKDAVRWHPIAVARPKLDGVFLTEQSVEYVRQVAHSLRGDYELIYSLAVDNGCRMIDIQRLTTRNARELLTQGISIILSKGRSGGKERPLVLSQQTFEPLTRFLRDKGKDGLLFGGISYMTLWRRMTHLSEISKVQFAPHDLRRTFGNRHWKIGTPIETIAKLLGHESVNMTFRAYIGVQMGDMLTAQSKLCPAMTSQQSAVRVGY
jgi:integrase